MTSILLVCAVLASLAAGVLIAYAACYVLFVLFRAHAESVSQAGSAALEPIQS